MTQDLTFTLAQINPTVGDISGNGEKILKIWSSASSDLVIFGELALSGYPLEDLVLKPSFVKHVHGYVQELVKQSESFKPAALIGCPWMINGQIRNALLLIEHGEIIHIQAKHHLPSYGVFDEDRVFKAGNLPEPVMFHGASLGLMICEDMWHPNVARHLAWQGAEILIVANASPFELAKDKTRYHYAKARAKETNLPLIYVNLVGGQDELVFDGRSFVMDAQGDIAHVLEGFKEDIRDYAHKAKGTSGFLNDDDEDGEDINLRSENWNVYNALSLGIGDYVDKNKFKGVLIGLSGGIDSALAAVLAVDALGADRVHCVMMPSPFTSQDSLDDAAALVENLGCAYQIISIEDAMTAFEKTLPDLKDTAHENMQSRIRGLILMALSNSTGYMVLTTGNKSEMAVGYATLYGDMCGGFNALKDVYKTQVYELCRWRNERGAIIPERILTKAPSAELKDNQTDQDSLPDYAVLDAILEYMIEHEFSVDDIVAKNHDPDITLRVWNMLQAAEYKRFQSAPGTKITTRAFGRDRRYPMTNGFKG